MSDSPSIKSYNPAPSTFGSVVNGPVNSSAQSVGNELFSGLTVSTSSSTVEHDTHADPNPHAQEETFGDNVHQDLHSQTLRDQFTVSNNDDAQKLIDASPMRVARYGEVEGRTPEEENSRASNVQGQTEDSTEKFNNAETFKATAFIMGNVGSYRA